MVLSYYHNIPYPLYLVCTAMLFLEGNFLYYLCQTIINKLFCVLISLTFTFYTLLICHAWSRLQIRKMSWFCLLPPKHFYHQILCILNQKVIRFCCLGGHLLVKIDKGFLTKHQTESWEQEFVVVVVASVTIAILHSPSGLDLMEGDIMIVSNPGKSLK